MWPVQVPLIEQEMPSLTMLASILITFNSNLHSATIFTDEFPISQIAKFECLMNYFSRDVPPGLWFFSVSNEYLDQYVTFSRFSPSLVVNWEESTKTFGSLKVHPTESISNLAHCVHTDFANMFLGGGVLEMVCSFYCQYSF